MDTREKHVLSNIAKIRTIRNITKRAMANEIGINEGSYARLENGQIALSYEYLARIASIFNMSVIDIITYPEKWAKIEGEEHPEPVEAILQIKLQKSKKDQVLRLIFGDNDIELLNH